MAIDFDKRIEKLKELANNKSLSKELSEELNTCFNILSNKLLDSETRYVAITWAGFIIERAKKSSLKKVNYNKTVEKLADLLNTKDLGPSLKQQLVDCWDILENPNIPDEQKHFTNILAEQIISDSRNLPDKNSHRR